ncbi:MAG: DNA-3-methyladenine glycosylase family protein [Candidatus Neomarinimicrobiota bacterium]|tara:strand:- start:25024 stop:25662 length:639 start_codon:yes stop_codon:yes gene_type:complete
MSADQIKSFHLEHSIKQLKQLDPHLVKLFDNVEVNPLNPEKNYFKALVRSIVYQQLSGSAAKTIFNRFKSIYSNDRFPSPKEILETDIETLRASGLSYNKSRYILNISQAFFEAPNTYDNLFKMNDNDIIDLLTKVKGVGLWTAQMFLMFTLNRPDIFPATDLAMQKGYQSYFRLSDLPKPNEMTKRSEMWIPYRTTVSLYFWAVLEGPFEW